MPAGGIPKERRNTTIIGAPPPPPAKVRIMFRLEMGRPTEEGGGRYIHGERSILVHGVSIDEAQQAIEKAMKDLVAFKQRVSEAARGHDPQ